ncbi:hypothetical protein AQ475_29010 [Burkholderia thailandensis]|nr:hypothetical protein AQ475_29010 [Burkholderia thailandensis]
MSAPAVAIAIAIAFATPHPRRIGARLGAPFTPVARRRPRRAAPRHARATAAPPCAGASLIGKCSSAANSPASAVAPQISE